MIHLLNVLLALLVTAEVIQALDIRQRHCEGKIRHVHLAVGPDPSTSMTVSFSSTRGGKPPTGAVLIGKSHQELSRLVVEKDTAIWYEAMQHNYKVHGNYTSPYQHHVLIEDLEPDTVYWYRCIVSTPGHDINDVQRVINEGHSSGPKGESIAQQAMEGFEAEQEREEQEGYRKRSRDLHEKQRRSQQQLLRHRSLHQPPYDSRQCRCPNPDKIRRFRTAPKPGKQPAHNTMKMAVIGDIGQFPHSEETLDHLIHYHGSVVDLVMLAGDLAYTEYDHRGWDTFMDFLDDYPLVDEVPLMITPGNHDVDKAEHDRKLFQAYETRFRMPQVKPAEIGIYDGPDGYLNMAMTPYPLPYEYGNAYYSFIYGPVYMIVLSSYSSMEPNSTQYKWFLQELEKVDRSVTPWLFCMFHCPVYNTFHVHHHDPQIKAAQKNLEPLLVKNHVNVVIAGHIHAYQRTEQVAHGKLNKKGPVHVVMGAGGRAANAPFRSVPPEEWVAVRDSSLYGYGIVDIFNSTHLRWDWVHTGEEADHNYLWNPVKKDQIELPPGGVDGIVIENQYFLDHS